MAQFDLTPYQRDILIKTALGEARGEGLDGMAAVVNNIINRSNSGRYPSDPAAVALQPKQYSTWNKGEGGNNPQQFKPGTKAYETAAQVVDGIASGTIPDNTGGALFYHANSISPSWANSVKTNGTLRVGNHTFYPTHPVPPGELPSVATLLDTQKNPPTPLRMSMNTQKQREANLPRENSAVTAALAKASPRNYLPAIPPSTLQIAPPNLISRSNELAASTRLGSLPQRPTNVGDSLGFNPIPRGNTSIPAMDASYDREQGVMVRPPSPVGEMPTLAATRAAFGLSPLTSGVGQPPSTRTVQSVRMPPLASPSPQQAPQRSTPPRVTVSTPFTVPQRMAGQDDGNVTRALPSQLGRGVPENGYQGPFAPSQPSYEGPFVPNKGLERLAAPAGLPVASVQTASFIPPTPAAQPSFTTQMQPTQVLNPAWSATPAAIPAGTPMSGGLSRDAVALRAKGLAQAQAMTNVPKFITVQRPVQVPARIPAPVQSPNFSPLRIAVNGAQSIPARAALTPTQQAQSQLGLTNAQAYAFLNSFNGGPRTAADRPGKSLSQSGGQAGATEHFW